MTVTATSFRSHWPEFSSTSDFPDLAVDFWIGVAVKMLPEDVWDTMLDNGVELFVAHHLALAKRGAAGSGATVGAPVGVVASKSVGPVSVSYNTGSISFDNAGHWNATTYGMQFWFLIKMFGAGGAQL